MKIDKSPWLFFISLRSKKNLSQYLNENIYFGYSPGGFYHGCKREREKDGEETGTIFQAALISIGANHSLTKNNALKKPFTFCL